MSDDVKALSPLAKATGRALRRTHTRVVRKALRKLEQGVSDAMGIDDDGATVPEDMRASHVAKDLRKSKRNAPYYLDVLLRRTESAEKLAAARDEGPRVSLNIGTVNVVVPPQYEVIDIEPTEK